MEIVNWNPDRGSPYYYHLDLPEYRYKEPTWEILAEDHWVNSRLDIWHTKKVIARSTVEYSSIWSFHLINDVAITPLIRDVYGNTIIMVDEFELDHVLTVYLDYPFASWIEVTISPLENKLPFNDDWLGGYFPVGYLFWQISKVYADIYKNHWEEAGVWGHGLSDLVFNGCDIYDDYSARLILSS